jgi:hypothetical protein
MQTLLRHRHRPVLRIAIAAPEEVQSAATDAQTKVDAAATSLSCPAASPSA